MFLQIAEQNVIVNIVWRFGSPSGLASSRRRQTDTLNLCKVNLLFSPLLSYIKGSLVNTSDSVSLFYYIVICKTDWNWKSAPKKCGPGLPTKMWPRTPRSLSPALSMNISTMLLQHCSVNLCSSWSRHVNNSEHGGSILIYCFLYFRWDI